MDKTSVINSPTDENSVYEADVDYYITEMKRLQNQMKDDRQEITLLQAETRAILADIRQTLKAA